MPLTYVVDFEVGKTPAEEHANIVRVAKSAASQKWELGARLARTYDKEEWRQLDPAPEDWSSYLREGIGLSLDTAYRYMRAAKFPRRFAEEHGIEKMALLTKITGVIGFEMTPEEWMELMLPVEGGSGKPFARMNVAEVERAYRLIKQGAQAQTPSAPRPKNPEAVALEGQAEAAVAEWLSPEQVVTRSRNGRIEIDVREVPREQAKQVFAALAAALPG